METGDQEWAFETPYGIESVPTVADGTVYVGTRENWGVDGGPLYAINAATGDQEWTFKLPYGVGQINSSPTVTDDTVYFSTANRALYALDAATGDQEWIFRADGSIDSSPIVVDGTLYVGSDNDLKGKLYAIDTNGQGSSKGSRVRLGVLGHHDTWEYADQRINSPPVASIQIDTPSPSIDEKVQFNGGGSSDPDGRVTTYEWKIDNKTYQGETVKHSFSIPGSYTIELKVVDENGAYDTTATKVAIESTANDRTDNQDRSNETAADGTGFRIISTLAGLMGSIYVFKWRLNDE